MPFLWQTTAVSSVVDIRITSISVAGNSGVTLGLLST